MSESSKDSGATATSASIPRRLVYRAMKEDPTSGLPVIGPTARTLGVRPSIDVPIVSGKVSPGTGGMSVTPDDPSHLPRHRRPTSLGGTGPDPVWELDLDELGPDLTFRQDKPGHGMIEPAGDMTLDDFQHALESTAPYWNRKT